MPSRTVGAVIALVALCGLPCPSGARTWIVDAGGAGDHIRIGDACLAAGPGDTVAVNPGEYDEYDGPIENVVILDKPLSVIGMGAGPEDVRARLSLGFEGCDPVLIQKLTFHDEHFPVWCGHRTKMTIQRCRFEDNGNGSFGGGAIIAIAELTVEDCVFLRNRTTCEHCTGGAINAGGDKQTWALTVRRCWFESNEAAAHGGAIQCAIGALLEDCVFVRNRAYNGAALTASGPALSGCTFYENETTWSEGAAVELEYHGPVRERCIIVGTINGYGMGCWSAVQPNCFCFWNNERGPVAGACSMYATDGCFEADPMFCDPENGNFRLQDGSPCLPGEHGGYSCGLIGAYGANCIPEPIEETSWGRVKFQFHGVGKQVGAGGAQD